MVKKLQHKINRSARLFLVVCLFLLAPAQGTALAAQAEETSPGTWPQFRGPEGLGISSDSNLPEVWSRNSPNIKWKTKIPGRGNSSPVVSNGRVILTTAYKSQKAAAWRTFIVGACSVLVVAYIAAALAAFVRKLSAEEQKGVPLARRALKGWPNTLFGLLTSLIFIALASLVVFWRGYSDTVFAKTGLFFSNHGYPDMEHLFSMDAGVHASVWLTSGGIAALGLAVAVGKLRAKSIWRMLGAAAVMLSVIPFAIFTPTDQWTEKIEQSEKLVFAIPSLVVAFWHLLNYFEIDSKQPKETTAAPSDPPGGTLSALNRVEIRWRHKNLWRLGSPLPLCSAILLAALSLLVFIPPNFFETQLGMQRVVLCLDKETGKLLWAKPVFIAPSERKHSDATYATPTAATDGSHIIVNFGVGVACLDFEGAIRWKKRDKGYFQNSRYGASSSPLLAGEMAIIVQEAEDHSKRPTWIAAFDKRTSLTRWRIQPENIRGCYTTPTLYRHGDTEQLIIASVGNVASYDVQTGGFLWMQRIPTEQLVASIAVSGDLFCIGGGTYGPNATVMMRMIGSNGRTRPEEIWQSDEDPPGDCSPVIYAGKLFTISDKGKITCFDAISGKIFWNKRLKGGRYLSSLIAGDGKVYACNTRGLTTVIAADEKFRIIAENDLKGRCFATPAFADSRIFLRIGPDLYCIEKERP